MFSHHNNPVKQANIMTLFIEEENLRQKWKSPFPSLVSHSLIQLKYMDISKTVLITDKEMISMQCGK